MKATFCVCVSIAKATNGINYIEPNSSLSSLDKRQRTFQKRSCFTSVRFVFSRDRKFVCARVPFPKHPYTLCLIEDDGEGSEEGEANGWDGDPFDPRIVAAGVRNYLTFSAVRIVLEQLSETNLQVYRWLYVFSNSNKSMEAEAFLRLMLSKAETTVKNPYSMHIYVIKPKELVQRIMSVRGHLARQLGKLPDVVESANLDIYRHHLAASLQFEGSGPLDESIFDGPNPSLPPE
mmetsp:Transcript_16941/g.28001  ORF Transcript_16941/g.28001 Transcript_16941/m.28001 type:complete len:234 (+) Transcript_16941:64-765(+)